MAPPGVIETERLLLRQPRMSDAGDVFANYASDPEVTRHMTWRPYNDQNEVATFLQSRLVRWQSGEEYSWVLTLPRDDRAIGMIGCRARDHSADIGYVLGRTYWSRGYTTEAARAIVERASRIETIYRLWAVGDVENKASARVLEKVGMRREGILGRYIVHPNVSLEPRDCFVYAKVR